MSALYKMQYVGTMGDAFGVIYIGKGVVAGMDIGGGQYRGSYVEEEGRLQGAVNLSGAGALVTGLVLQPGQAVTIPVDLPVEFADGTAHDFSVGGSVVRATFEKIADIP